MAEPDWWPSAGADLRAARCPRGTAATTARGPVDTGRRSTSPTPSTPPRRSRPAPRVCGTGCLSPRQDESESTTRAPSASSRAPAGDPPGRSPADDSRRPDALDAHWRRPTTSWEDQTGGLEVIGDARRGGAPRRRGRPARPTGPTSDEALRRRRDSTTTSPRRGLRRRARHSDEHDDDDARPRRGVRRGHPGQAVRPAHRAPRAVARPVAVLVSLLVLAGLVVGIVFGGQKLLAPDRPRLPGLHRPGQRRGRRSGSQEGDTLSDIARTLVDADVIASIGPFVDAAEANAAAVGIQPGVYGMRLADERPGRPRPAARPGRPACSPGSRCPRGSRSSATLARLAEETGEPDRGAAGRRGGPRRPGPAGLRQRLARGLPLPGHLRLRARHHGGRHAAADGRPRHAGARRAADPRGRPAEPC